MPLPHSMKMDIVKACFLENNCKIFVETGTYMGETTQVMSSAADFVYTIELGEDLYKAAVEKFKDTKNIKCCQGDSTQELPKILKTLDKKPLFWLDGHYSAGITAKGEKYTPIFEELEAIHKANIGSCVILIDDARLFDSDPNYPTAYRLYLKIHSLWKDAHVESKGDIIRVTL